MEWLILGIIVGGAALWFYNWTQARHIKVTWYEWALIAIAAISALVGIQNILASISELESQAALPLAVLFGIPALFFAVLAWRLIARHQAPVAAPAKN